MAQNTAHAVTGSREDAQSASGFCAPMADGIDVVPKPAPAHWEPLPGALRRSHGGAARHDNHLARDFILVFLLVMGACLAFFLGQPLVSGALQSPDLTKLFVRGAGAPDDTPPPAPAAAPEISRAVVTRRLNLRALPSTDAPVITALKQGMVVTILERDGNWAHVRIDQPARQGWAYGRYLADGKNPAR